MNTKVNEGKLISGKDALIALANGDEVEWTHFSVGEWHKVPQKTAKLQYFLDDDLGWKFRLKPRTITINGIEMPAPFEPKHGDEIWFLHPDYGCGYLDGDYDPAESYAQFGAWRTEEEIKQVISALRFVLNGGWHEQ